MTESSDLSAEIPRARMWSTAAWIACSLVVAALIVAGWLRVQDERGAVRIANAIVAGERPRAPELPASGITDDGAPGLPQWYGSRNAQIMVVNWWASWCGPCKEEAPVLQEISNTYEGRVTVIGLNAGAQDLESDARAFVREHELTFPIVRGTRVDESSWGTRGFPETFIVGSDGRISAHIDGPVDAEQLRALLDRELDRA